MLIVGLFLGGREGEVWREGGKVSVYLVMKKPDLFLPIPKVARQMRDFECQGEKL